MAFAPVFSRQFAPTFDRHAAAAAAPGMTNFFLQAYTGSRNNYNGTVGYEFTIGGSNLTVVALGRSVSGFISGNHRTGIWTTAGVLLDEVTIIATSLVDGLGYAYETLGAPIVLSAGVTYVIGSEEISGGDLWMDLATISNHRATATIGGGRYSFGGGFGYPSGPYGGAETGYVPVTFFT